MFIGKTKHRIERLEHEVEFLRQQLRERELAHARLLSHLQIKERRVYEHTYLEKSEDA